MTNITTFTKKTFDPLAPEAELIDVRDIAHSLSMLCRANGHFPTFYSVAQHSLNCMREAKERGLSERVQFACLIHDASEAYISDITRPVKSALPEYKEIEKKLESAIYEKYLGGITAEEYAAMREIDDVLLYHEFLRFMGEKLWAPEPKLFSKPRFYFELFGSVEKDFTSACACLQTACGEPGKENAGI
ncbi:MAG: HD domain-containing protein [Clostridia bacterium]|nr:HD domain-containing protein [Clostridia bacterium]